MAIRPEIQALRGIAVAIVVIGHLWPGALPGGFTGVDVFFVVSGFLITAHLVREIDRDGRVSLGAFWARRARRILPAALFVLLFCALATIAFVPETRWPQFLSEIRASTLYVENWRLAADAVDYFASAEGPSPVQHYWSLSAEEQFYLVWPVALTLLALVTPRRLRRRGLAALMGTLALASLIYSITDTASDPAAAYFVTTTRAWEFAAGGLLALFADSGRRHRRLRSAVSWLGLAAIGIAAVTYSPATAFPGFAAALPVAGALAVIWAAAPARALLFSPLLFLGDISYSVYLWHWPLRTLAPYATGRPVDTFTTLTVLMFTLLLAWLTKLIIEDPVRSGRLLTRHRASWTFACAGGATALVLAVLASGSERLSEHVRDAERASQHLLAEKPTCFAAAARDRENRCSNPKLRLTVVPTPIEAHKQRGAPCPKLELRGLVYVCGFGERPGRATSTVALIGDSHASHWRAALDKVARERHWAGVSLSHTGCPLSKATKNLPQPRRGECVEWNRQVLKWLARHPEVKTVFVSQISGGAGVVAPGRNQLAAQRAGYTAAWKALPASVEQVVVVRDTPKVLGDTDSCVERAIGRHQRAGQVCRVARRAALTQDSAAVAATAMRSARVRLVDLTDFFCDRGSCFPVIGGALVFKDQNHMTETFSASLAPYLARALGTAEASTPPGLAAPPAP
jgi:peptidoglycan/LPS O-acetylase OafA/YrhL